MINENIQEYSLGSLKEKCRVFTRQWLSESEEHTSHIKNNFERITGNVFWPNRIGLYDTLADHYAEKIYSFVRPYEEYHKLIMTFSVDGDSRFLIQDTLRRGKVPILFTGHFLGNDLMPALMGGSLTLPNTTFHRVKSELTRKLMADQRLVADKFLMQLADVDKGLSRVLVKLKKEPRVLFTVVDSLDMWKIDAESPTVSLFGRQYRADNTPDRLARFLNAEVFWSELRCTGPESYSFKARPVEMDMKGGYTEPLLKLWEKHILNNPFQVYSWEELHELDEIQHAMRKKHA